jgi:CBS domain containing-hemolysin-like protein
VAREIVVPRPSVVALRADTPLRELDSFAAAGSHTQYPIYEGESPERIVGSVHAKDVLRAVESEGSLDADIEARNLARDVVVVPVKSLVEMFPKTSRSRNLRWQSS